MLRILLLGCFILLGNLIHPCTSFSCYSSEIWYGMNFDYPDYEIQFRITSENDSVDVFEMGFIQNGFFYSVYGFNSFGNFTNLQMLFPETEEYPVLKENDISTFQAWYYFLNYYENVNSFLDHLRSGASNRGVLVKQQPPLSLHSMMSDPGGNAIVLEAGTDRNEITSVNNGILVMTNFANYLYREWPYKFVMGAGADRYIAAYESLLNSFEEFDYDAAWQALEVSMQRKGEYKTRCSTIFNPETQEIYIVLQRDMDHIWRFNFDEKILETFFGFENYRKYSLAGSGVSSIDLKIDIKEDMRE